MKQFIVLILTILSFTVKGQLLNDSLEQLAEIYIEENEDAGDFTEVYEWMESLTHNQVDLNRAGLNELLNIPFLKMTHVSRIIDHRKSFGNLLSIYELQVLPDFSIGLIKKISPFISIKKKELNISELRKNSVDKLYLRYTDHFEEPKGVKEGQYLGGIGKSYLRYQKNMNNQVYLGLVIENDAYEPLFQNGRTVDFISAHLQVKDWGKIDNLVIGDFQANFGQGLVLGAGFGGYKSYEGTNVGGVFQGVKKYSSVNESLFLRGGAMSFKLNSIKITPFYSINKVDASIGESLDTLANVSFQNIQTSGFHRTISEIESRNKLLKQDYGLTVNKVINHLEIGYTYLRNSFSESKQESDRLYKRLELHGKVFNYHSLSYNYLYKNVLLMGEVAIQNGDRLSHVNKLLMSLSSSSEFLLVYRDYAPGYFALNGKSFGEKANISNEKGIYMGFKTAFNNKWSLSLYTDFYTFPWLRYSTASPSRGKDIAVKLKCKLNKKNDFYFRFKNENYSKNSKIDGSNKRIVKASNTKFRAHFGYDLNERMQAATRVELACFSEELESKSNGILFYQEFKYQLNRYWKFGIRGSIFSTDDYNSRIYAFEQNVLYNFTIPAFYDKGFRSYLLVQYKPFYNLNIQAKLARTSYLERTEIGSGNDLIHGNKKTTLVLQANLKW